MTGLTRVERVLHDAGFGAAVLVGFSGDREAIAAARADQAEARAVVGYRRMPAPVLTSGASQHKLGKNTLPSFGLMLMPERGLMSDKWSDIRSALGVVGPVNLCPLASQGCAAACLSTSGQSGMPAQQRAQAVRTAILITRPWTTAVLIGAELRRAIERHDQVNLRLNTTSDIRWEYVAPDMIRPLTTAGVIMYDYTAWRPRHRKGLRDYTLTYSAKEPSHTPDGDLETILSWGGTVAMPFDTPRGADLPETWHGHPVIDGDLTDERYLDPAGVVVGLRAKGNAWRRDNTAGFIRSGVSS